MEKAKRKILEIGDETNSGAIIIKKREKSSFYYSCSHCVKGYFYELKTNRGGSFYQCRDCGKIIPVSQSKKEPSDFYQRVIGW
jgi:predicted SprT family Zn-dependent metalloprotease